MTLKPDSIPDRPSERGGDALPPRLVEDLAALHAAPRIPRSVDARVLNGAAAALARQGRNRRWIRWGGAGAAAAAAVIIAAMMLPTESPTHHPQVARSFDAASPATHFARIAGDVDGNGRVDILDAFSLARTLRDADGRPVPTTAADDFNGDGRVDQADVDLIAQLAVRTAGG